ncbi:MAG TPA: GNAT family protein [Actinomycetota bacterium]|nr:GNAT family protein [Actinomycetota bacterium]
MTRVPPREPIRTERLVLWPVDEAWAEAHREAVGSSIAELRPWMPWAAAADLRETRRFVESSSRAWAEGRTFDFSVVEDGSGAVAGGLGLTVISDEAGIIELGYWVRADRRGRGYAVEAGAAAVELAFGPLSMHRVELRAGVGNTASRRVAEKLGFTLESDRLRDSGLGADGRYDCCLYARLVTDPSARG